MPVIVRSTAVRATLRVRHFVYTLRYSEQRFVTPGLLAGVPVSIVHTETAHEIRIISFRQATRREAQIFFDAVKD